MSRIPKTEFIDVTFGTNCDSYVDENDEKKDTPINRYFYCCCVDYSNLMY